MKFFIDSHALKRLVDPDIHVRQRSLKELTSILQNNILFEAAANQGNDRAQEELQVVNLDELTRQLIRWFQFKPVTDSEEILDLLILIWSRKDFLHHITKTISVQRLKKEMIKVAKMLLPEKAALKLYIIDQLLTHYENEAQVIASDTGSFPPIDNESQKDKIESLESHFLDRMKRLQISSPATSNETTECDETIEVFSEFWKRLRGKDLDIFNKLDEELLIYNNQEAFKKALEFLRASVEDFPPEYFLQPPNIFETLMDILWNVPSRNGVEIVRILRFIINGLKDNWIEARTKRAYYIPFKKQLNKIFQIFTNFFERFHDEFNPKELHHHQEILNEIYALLFDLIDFLKESHHYCEIYLNELLNVLAKVVKDFRLTEESFSCKINYLVTLYLINVFLSSVDTTNLSYYSQNNVWEYECDIALLDLKLKTKHEKIYKLILKNRSEIIKDDKDLELLLNIETLWQPAVQVFQNYESLSEKYIIGNASKAINVIRVLNNPKFVDIAFKAIFDSSYRFHVDTSLKNEAEEIFLRLLSIDVPEIKLRTYKLSRENIQKRITDDFNHPNDVDLCSVIGIPFNTETITEIVCFGLLDNDIEVQKQAANILFTILRGKVIFPNQWEEILNIMRPVLAMMPCLFAKEPKLGFFAFDIYNQHSGFTKDELNLAYARFLFCTHPNAREMAKRKLLENFDEYSSDFIEIVPENFCILSHDQINELQIPDRNIGYDHEDYAHISQLLKSPSVYNDQDLIRSTLLHLSILMNSSKLCQKSHDDNLWIYFMASLDMNHPNNATIRKLTINILYKWTVTIPSFRIYLANEPKALQFIINTLIYYQDDLEIKKQASSFLFLVLFSDFVVVNNATSLPNILSTLECPFRFSKHWEESPFNKISQIEWLYESMERDNNRDSDIRKITQKYFKLTFAHAWFHNNIDFSGEFYDHDRKNALRVPEKILMSESDFKELREFSIESIVDKLTNSLANLTTSGELMQLMKLVVCGLNIPNINIEKMALKIDKELSVRSFKEKQKFMFIKLIELYQHLIPYLSDARIVNIMREKSIDAILNSQLDDQEVLIESLKLINSVIKIFKTRKDLANKIIKRYNDELKIYFPSRLIEKLFVNFMDNFARPRMLNDLKSIPAIKMILTTMKNVLTHFPVILDEQFINSTFQDLLTVTKVFLSPHKDFVNTHMVFLLHAIIERFAFHSCHINLKSDNFNVIFLWLSDHQKRDNSLMWKIVAELTKRNQHFVEFCKGFEEVVKISFYDIVCQLISTTERETCGNERNSQALVVGNLLDHICESNIRDLGMKNNRKTANEIRQDLAKLFIDQKPNNIDAICFLIKKMLANNMMYNNSGNVYQVSEIVKQKNLIEFLLKNSVENLDTVVACYRYKELEKYVSDVLCGVKDEAMHSLIVNIKCPYDKSTQNNNKINKNLLSLILVLLQSPDGYEKAYKAISKDKKTFNDFISIIFHGLQSENAFGEIMFHFEVISALLNYENDFFTNQVSNLVSGDYLTAISESLIKFENNTAESFVRNNLKQVQYAVDLVMLQVVALFDNINSVRFNTENKYDMRAQIFLIVKNLMSSNEQAQIFASKIDLMGIVLSRVKVLVNSIGTTTKLEMNKKSGVTKSMLISKELCMYIMSMVEWNLPPESTSKVDEFFSKIISVYSWIHGDYIVLNAFINFLQLYSSYKFAKICLTKEYNGTTIMKGILKKVFELSSTPPHTSANLKLIENILHFFAIHAKLVDVRLLLKNSKIFNMLDILHPQLQKSRKTSWNEVLIIWLKFYEKLSLIEDPDCNPNQISLLCRLIRTDDNEISNVALKVIRNVAIKSSVGYAMLQSIDFMETVNNILDDEWKNESEKVLILQTLLSLSSKSEQMRSKLKNSSFNRKLRDYLATLKANENLQIFNLTTMLSDILYPQ